LTEEWIYHALGCGREEVASRQGGRLINFLRDNLAYLEAKRIGEWVLAEKRQPMATGDDAFFLNQYAYTLDDLGEHHKASDYYEQALTIDRAVFGDNHPDVAIDLNNLGSVYLALGEKQKAKKYFQQAYAICNQFLGPEHPCDE
jgi:tetratricopeptide (TPR) repeat protein